MRADEGNRLCQEAEVHYYDLLGPDEAAVPESIRRHVAACSVCQEQMRRLREALFEAERPRSAARSGDDETIEALAQQFQLLEEHVTCAEIKPFLPKLALATRQIRIPTPVTVHVDHCPRCAEDLAALRTLDLATDQLQRLSEFFASGSREDALGVEMSSLVEDTGIACRDVSRADLFDAVVPYGAPPDDRRRAMISHVRTCRMCREAAQALRRRIWAILERTDSGTTTVYHAESDVKHASGEVGSPYPYPIDVEVWHGASTCGTGPDTREQRRHAPFSAEREALSAGTGNEETAEGPLLVTRRRSRVALVAVGLAALLLLRWANTPTAFGTGIGALLKPLAEVRSVHIVSTYRNNKQPTQQFWIAYHSNRLVVNGGEHFDLYDLNHNCVRKTERGMRAGPPVRLSKVQWDGTRRLVGNYLRDVMMCVSPDTKLPPSMVNPNRETTENLDVYETTWLSHARSRSLQNKQRVYVDPATGLPQKMELYREMHDKARGGTSWDLLTTTVFTYPTEQEMDREIETMFPAQ
jgi:hypothetical protein